MSDLLNNYTLEFEKPVRDLENQIKRKYEGTTSLIKIFLEDRDEDYPAVEFIEVWYLRGD